MEIEELKQQINDPTSLSSFSVIKGEYDDQVRYGLVQDKLELADYLNDMLSARGKDIANANAEMFNQYQVMVVMLSFGSFVAQDLATQTYLLQKRLLYAVQRGLNPDDVVNQYFAFFETDDFVADQFRSLVQLVEQNTETLGRMPIETENNKFVPELKYWLADYAKFPSKVAQRGAVERLSYLNQSPNTRQLTQVQRQNLLGVLKFYDDLLHPERPAAAAAAESDFDQALGGLPEVPVAPMARAGQNSIDEKIQALKSRVG